MYVHFYYREKACNKNDVRHEVYCFMHAHETSTFLRPKYVDAQSCCAIIARFGGMKQQRRQEALLKHLLWKTFSASSSSTKAVKIEDASEKAMCSIDGAGFDWSDMTEEEIQANMALMAFSDSELHTKKFCKLLEGQFVKSREHEVFYMRIALLRRREVETNEKLRENTNAPIIEDWVSNDEDDDEPNPKVEKKTVIPTATKKEFVKPEKPAKRSVNTVRPFSTASRVRKNNDAPIIEDWVSDDEDEVETTVVVKKKTVIPTAAKIEKPVRKPVRYAEMYRSQRPRGNQRNWNGQKSNQLGCNFVFNNKACFICGSFDHIQYSCPNQQRKRIVSGNNYNKEDNDYYSRTSHPSAHKHMAPRAVLMKTGLKSFNTARPVNTVRSVNTGRPFSTARSFNTVRPFYTAHPKSTIHCARPRTYFQNQAQSTVNRPFYKRTTLTKRCFNQRFNTSRPFRSTVNTVRARGFNAVKPSACWVWRPIKPNGASLVFNKYNYIDARGRSKHHFIRDCNAKKLIQMAKIDTENNVADLLTKGFDAGRFQYLVSIAKATSEDQCKCIEGLDHINFKILINFQENLLERKNRTLIEAARTMLADSKLPTTFWAEAVSTACYELFLMTLHVSKGVLSPSTSSQQDQDNQDCIIMPIWKDASYFGDAAPRFVADAQIQDKDGLQDEMSLQKKFSTVVPEVNTATPEDLVGPSHASEDTQVEDQEIELGNIPQSNAVPTTPHTKIHKDHPIKHVIGDVQSSVQTRRMTTSYSELGFLSAIYEGKPNHARHTCPPPLICFVIINSKYNSQHNIAAFLEKSTGSEGFHQVIDFLSQSHISYALTKKPEIYISFIKQFWRTAEASTDTDGEVTITAIIDGQSKTITEASLRRHLKLEDHDGITSIPNSEIFEQLALMGYQTDSDKLTFQKGVFSPQWRFLIHTLLHCLSPKKTAWEQFSSNIATALICLATNRKYNFSRLIFEHMVTNIGSPHKFLMYPRFIQICLDMQKKQLKTHSSTYPVPSLNNKVFSNMRRLTKGYTGVEIGLFPTMLTSPTPSSSPSRITSSPSLSSEPSTEPTFEPQPSPDAEYHVPTPNESPLHAVHSHGSDEGSLKLIELMNLVTKLSERIGVLEDDLKRTKQTYSAAFTKLILRIKKLESKVKTGKARKRARVVLSEDEEDDSSKQGRIDEDPNTYFAQDDEVVHDQDTAEEGQPEDSTAGITVSTAPINISTARETRSTAGRVVYGRRSKEARKDKGKAIMTEPEPEKKSKKLLEQERLGLEEAIRLQEQVDEEERAQRARDEEIARQLLALDEERATSEPKTTKDIDWNDPSVQKYHYEDTGNRDEISSLEERTRSTAKKQKVEQDDEKEELKNYLDIVPREDVAEDVESLSTKYPIMDWKTYTLSEKFMYYKIIRGDGSSKNYKILSEMLYDFDRQDIMKLYRLVKERYSSSKPEGYDLMLWGDLHILFEPDEESEIWMNQNDYNLISWSLCDFCGVHILLMQNGIAIHMITEKKYPLSQEMLSQMLSKRLEVDHESTQAYELLKFIRSQVKK
ncbi:copia protein [Tanacetum coccineum]|uniref:Copia protein n=1 Tax=Tanacetum coccineum TaxID=301880 RepID=A0ABQ5BHA9_9ASTR